jgi:hypothetical protein
VGEWLRAHHQGLVGLLQRLFGDFYSEKSKKVATNFQSALKKSQKGGDETLP